MKAAFKQRDVKAAIRAVEAAGKEVGSVEVAPDGTVRIILLSPLLHVAPGGLWEPR